MSRLINLKGKVFERWTVHDIAGQDKQGQYLWNCTCVCGKTGKIRGYALRYGTTTSCGCLRDELLSANPHGLRHGATKTRVYQIWAGIKGRCLNPDDTVYYLYGARGVTICIEWQDSFEAFYAHVGDPPSDIHSIDRIKNSLGYQPGNVKWSTPKQQGRNRGTNVNITYLGQTKCVSEWAEFIGVPRSRLNSRLLRGWPIEIALATNGDASSYRLARLRAGAKKRSTKR
jgi:hypothetical protein